MLTEPATKKEIPLVLITGFLGSGKTSVINSLLEQLGGKRIGLILNDFGKINIDATLVPKGNDILTKELNGGQIFCSCLSQTFVETVAALGKLDLDLILIETSGLSKPAPLLEIVSWIQEKNPSRFSYRGMVCVVDAKQFLPLSKVLLTLEEQVVFSDLFVVNKIDLVDAQTLSQVTSTLSKLQSSGKIVLTKQGKLSLKSLDVNLIGNRVSYPSRNTYGGWGVSGRPKTCLFKPGFLPSLPEVSSFLQAISPFLYRMKGYLKLKEIRVVYISAVGSQVEVREILSPREEEDNGLICIFRPDYPAVEKISEIWFEKTGNHYIPEIV
jgi:G3E family GTPase